MMSLKVSIFFRSSIISIKFCLHTLEFSIIVSTTSFVVLDTSKLVACRNKHFFFFQWQFMHLVSFNVFLCNSHKFGFTMSKIFLFSRNLLTVTRKAFSINSTVIARTLIGYQVFQGFMILQNKVILDLLNQFLCTPRKSFHILGCYL